MSNARPTASPRTLLVSLGVVALVTAACGTSSHKSTAATTAAPAGAPALPEYAQGYHASFVSPTDGFTLTANTLPVTVTASGYDLTCALAGKPGVAGKGHYHLLLDKVLVNMFCTPGATVSMQNVKPGKHTLEVLPALNDHSEVEGHGQTINFDYKPTSPLPVIPDSTSTEKPAIKILSPRPGAVVSGTFDVTVSITGFHPSCDLMGKPDVLGYGHWHINLDTMTGPMLGMGTMMGMSCAGTFHATTAGLRSGETHTIIALLTDNGHAPLHPAVDDKLDVKIG